jgi:hypothetical protein
MLHQITNAQQRHLVRQHLLTKQFTNEPDISNDLELSILVITLSSSLFLLLVLVEDFLNFLDK